ncbi:MAG: hypothetical protein ACI88H_001410 [Cocleimonas sp.]|jgi:hypothetical protein
MITYSLYAHILRAPAPCPENKYKHPEALILLIVLKDTPPLLGTVDLKTPKSGGVSFLLIYLI